MEAILGDAPPADGGRCPANNSDTMAHILAHRVLLHDERVAGGVLGKTLKIPSTAILFDDIPRQGDGVLTVRSTKTPGRRCCGWCCPSAWRSTPSLEVNPLKRLSVTMLPVSSAVDAEGDGDASPSILAHLLLVTVAAASQTDEYPATTLSSERLSAIVARAFVTTPMPQRPFWRMVFCVTVASEPSPGPAAHTARCRPDGSR